MKYFIDCGGHHGERLKHFIDLYNIDPTWKIYTFEPNIESFEILKKVEYKGCDINAINSGIWIENSKLTFRPETTQPKYGGRNDGEGSTFMKADNWKIKSINNPGAGDFLQSYEIAVVDLSDFIKNLEDKEYLLIKMDIEGSEYNVLRRLIETEVINDIDDLHVEFHHWAMSSENIETTRDLIKEIEELDVNIRDWA